MAQLQGTLVASKIVPTDSLDTFATHDEKYGRGGFRSVADIIERDAITPERRREGMLVYVTNEDKFYQLTNGIDDTNWTEKISNVQSNSSVIQMVAGASVSSGIVVATDSNGLVVPAQPDQGTVVLGISKNAASANESIYIVTQGEYTDPAWNWIVGLPIFYTTDGDLTQDAPLSIASTQIAIPTTPTKILIQRMNTIFLA